MTRSSLRLWVLGVTPLMVSATLRADPPGDAFRMPSGNVSCVVTADESGAFLRCDLSENQARIPKPPQDCELDFGNAFALGLHGKATRLCAGDTVAGGHPVLAYGQTWSSRGFTCLSRKQGVRCTNADGHGFELSRKQQKLF